MKKHIDNQEGVILVTVILLMAIVALLGVIAINTSTVDIQISGNMRRASSSFGGAEAGIDMVVPIIESTLAAGALTPTVLAGGAIDPGGDLLIELTGGSDYNADTPAASPDVVLNDLNGVEIKVDIDRLYAYTLPGGAMEFAAGYEGVGAAAAGGGVGVLFRVTSEGTR
jgi:hypothetical protein